MATKIGGITVELKALTATFQKDMKAARQDIRDVGASMKNLAVTAAAAFGAFKAASAIRDFTRAAFSTIDATAKLSDRLAISTESVQGLRVQADLTGVSLESITHAMDKARDKIGEAASGNKEAAKTFYDLGLSLDDLRRMRPDEQFGAIADALNQFTDANTRAKYAQDLFGKGAAELGNILRDGSAGMKAGREEAERLGYAVSRVDAAKVEAANDAMTRTQIILKGIGQQIAIKAAPFIEAIATEMVDATSKSEAFHDSIKDAFDSVVKGAGYVADVLVLMKRGWMGVNYVISLMGAGFWGAVNLITNGVDGLVQIVQAMAKSFMAQIDLIGSAFSFMWEMVKGATVRAAAFIGEKFAEVLFTMSDGARAAGLDIAGDLTDAAHRIGMASSAAAAKATADMGKSADALKASALAAGKAWLDVFKMPEANRVSWVHDVAEQAKQDVQEAEEAIAEELAKPLPSEAVIAWAERVKAKAQEAAKAIADASPGSKGVESGVDKSANPPNEKNQKDLEELQRKFMDRRELELDEHSKTLEQIAELDAKFALEDVDRQTEINDLMEREQERHEDAMMKLTAARYADNLDVAANTFGNLSTLMQSHNKKMFAIGKMAAYGQAVMSTAAGVAKTFEQLGWYALFGPAEAVAVAGAAQIASISSQNFGGGGGGRASVGGGGGSSGIPDSSNIGGPGVAGAGRGPARINLTLNGSSFTAEQVRDLIDQINEAQADGRPVN